MPKAQTQLIQIQALMLSPGKLCICDGIQCYVEW